MSQHLVPVQEIERMAVAVAKSSLFGIRTQEQATALMLIAQAEGLHPAIAARDYHVIQGRPALKADAMLARFQAAGGKVEWHTYCNDEVTATFSHPSGGSVKIQWTMAMAKAAGLGGKDVWKQYPRAMLRSRVISEGIRTVYPGVSVGVYTPEELQDFDAKPKEAKEIKVEVSSAPSVATRESDVVEETVEIPTISTVPPPNGSSEAKEYYINQVKNSGWSKADLARYTVQVLGKESAAQCTLADWMKLSHVTSTYKSAEEAFKTEAK